MAINEPQEGLIIKNTFTLNEAIEYMKLMDKYHTKDRINWVDSKTGKPVSIGYNSNVFL